MDQNLTGLNPSLASWTQQVFQVDGGPRYQCTAAWKHEGEQLSWNCDAPAPLPRRETDTAKRTNYNLMLRGNTVTVSSTGWIHHEENTKVKVETSGVATSFTPIANEVGDNTYKQVDPSLCKAAETWWKENKSVWNTIDEVWSDIYNEYDHLKFKSTGAPLWVSLTQLAESEAEKSALDQQANREAFKNK